MKVRKVAGTPGLCQEAGLVGMRLTVAKGRGDRVVGDSAGLERPWGHVEVYRGKEIPHPGYGSGWARTLAAVEAGRRRLRRPTCPPPELGGVPAPSSVSVTPRVGGA